jgi:glycosyltransferase involved in cell wall biosynthesis
VASPETAVLPGRPLRIVLAHEWLVRHAGSERVLEQMLAEFPQSRVLTTIRKDSNLPPSLRGSEASFLDHLPGIHEHHEWFVPLMPLAWRLRTEIDDVDAVIASSHACASAVRVAVGVPLISYCHTPMRYAWDFESEAARFPAVVRPVARLGMALFRRWDRQTAARVTRFIANSRPVAGRIERFYRREAIVIHPPVRTGYFTPGDVRGDRFLYVGRLTGYKRPDLVVEAFRDMPYELDVVGEGPLLSALAATAPANVRFHGVVDDDVLLRLYRQTAALVYPVDEDFGIAMAEAQSCGAPVIGLEAGGALDIVEPEVTGWLVARQSVTDVRAAVRRAAEVSLSAEAIRQNALRFSETRFRNELRETVEEVVDAARKAR